MPLFSNQPDQSEQVWEPQAAEGRLAKTASASQAGVFTSDPPSPSAWTTKAPDS